MSNLLKLREEIKEKKPKFARQSSHKIKRIAKGWRKPRGLHSKQRLMFRGYYKHISSGYGAPREVKGLHNSGLTPVMVYSDKEVDSINEKKECAIISKRLGAKKKLALLKKLKEKNVRVVNIKDTDAFIKAIEEKHKKKIEDKKAREKETKKKKADEKPKDQLADKVLTEEEKKEKEKEEKDKLLTRKE